MNTQLYMYINISKGIHGKLQWDLRRSGEVSPEKTKHGRYFSLPRAPKCGVKLTGTKSAMFKRFDLSVISMDFHWIWTKM